MSGVIYSKKATKQHPIYVFSECIYYCREIKLTRQVDKSPFGNLYLLIVKCWTALDRCNGSPKEQISLSSAREIYRHAMVLYKQKEKQIELRL